MGPASSQPNAFADQRHAKRVRCSGLLAAILLSRLRQTYTDRNAYADANRYSDGDVAHRNPQSRADSSTEPDTETDVP